MFLNLERKQLRREKSAILVLITKKCNPWLTCLAGTCEYGSKLGEVCGYRKPCLPGQNKCITLGKIRDSCSTDNDCNPWLSCVNMKREYGSKLGEVCGTSRKCLTGLSCIMNKCNNALGKIGDEWDRKENCNPWLECIYGTCEYGNKLGQECGNGKQCLSNLNCINLTCVTELGKIGDACTVDAYCSP